MKVLNELAERRRFGMKLSLEQISEVCGKLGDPQLKVKAIHIAGTNGKGSTSAMLESILRAHGLRTGLYTSPHLLKLGERIQVNRRALSDETICEEAETLYTAAKQFGKPGDEDFPSFFELMTTMAFRHFARERCDVAIVETGLGGRLDATNILSPAVSVITSVGLDHTEFLGNTIEEIAREKAGIIKPNTPVVLGLLPEKAEQEIRKIALKRSAEIFSVREIFLQTKPEYPSLPETNLYGEHQRGNAAAALLAAKIFFEKSGKQLDESLSFNALKNVNWRARWEKITLSDGRTLILDVAHNAEGAEAIDKSLTCLCSETGTRPQIITGVLGMERARSLLHVFSKHASAIHFVRPAQERACTFEELRPCIPEKFCGEITETDIRTLFPEKNSCSLKTPNNEPILVAGSCYLAGEVLAALSGELSESKFQDKLK
jgi:dihydrofolate synthase/folylpolyglutamate synthase